MNEDETPLYFELGLCPEDVETPAAGYTRVGWSTNGDWPIRVKIIAYPGGIIDLRPWYVRLWNRRPNLRG